MIDKTTAPPITLDNLVAMDARGMQLEIVNGAWLETENAMTGELHGAIQAYLIFLLLGPCIAARIGSRLSGGYHLRAGRHTGAHHHSPPPRCLFRASKSRQNLGS